MFDRHEYMVSTIHELANISGINSQRNPKHYALTQNEQYLISDQVILLLLYLLALFYALTLL